MRDDVQDKDRLPVLQELVNDYITQKQSVLLQVKKGQMSREDFMEEVKHLPRAAAGGGHGGRGVDQRRH